VIPIATPFGAILRRAVERTPNAIGGAFADPEGEMVDSFAKLDPHEWAILTAHYGVVMQHLVSAFGTWHYGGPEYFIASHQDLDVVVHAVTSGYYALLACNQPAPIAIAIDSLRDAASELRREMAL
jgi:hypothetical protein